MTKRFSTLCFFALLASPCALMAQDRTIVIPLSYAKYMIAEWQGDWGEGVSYKKNDGVQYDGSTYLCKEPHVADLTTSPDLDTERWDLIAAKGAQGATGADGHDGIVTEVDPTVPANVKDGVSWTEVSNRPAGLDDGDDVGITAESDPQIGTITSNFIPRWSSPALVTGSIEDHGTGWIKVSDSDGYVKINSWWTDINTGSHKAGVSSEINEGTYNISYGLYGSVSNNASQRYGVYGTVNGESAEQAYGVYGISSGVHGIGVYGSGDLWGGYFESNVKIGPETTWSTAVDNKTISFGDGDFVVVGETEADDVMTMYARKGITLQSHDFNVNVKDSNMIVQGTDEWNSTGDEAIIGFGVNLDHFFIKAAWGDGLKLGVYGVADPFVIKQSTGNVGIGTANPVSRLDVNGTTTTKVLTITGGADIAESFDINTDNTIRPGMVLSIDADNPGHLKISEHAYDHSVAGIVSGGRGIKTGMMMGQAGSIADGSHPVALTGRVYCLADASQTQIEPGDLLTTSDIPGYAMKVTDHTRSSGSIIGKAMTPLKQGRGMILVLVSLQ